jgi:hypothetical protein
MFKSMFVGACFAMLLTGCPDQNYDRARGVDADRERRDHQGEARPEEHKSPDEQRP